MDVIRFSVRGKGSCSHHTAHVDLRVVVGGWKRKWVNLPMLEGSLFNR